MEHFYPPSNLPKQRSREFIAMLAREHSTLLWDHRQDCLRVDWMELAGQSAETARWLFRQGWLRNHPNGGRYIGVDKIQVDAGDLTWKDGVILRQGEMVDAVNYLSPLTERVGVLFLDTESNGSNKTDLRAVIKAGIQLAIRRMAEIGEFLMVVNITTIRTSTKECRSFQQWMASQLETVGVSGEVKELVYPSKSNSGSMWVMPVCFGFHVPDDTTGEDR